MRLLPRAYHRQNALGPDCCVRATTAAESPRFARQRIARAAAAAPPGRHPPAVIRRTSTAAPRAPSLRRTALRRRRLADGPGR